MGSLPRARLVSGGTTIAALGAMFFSLYLLYVAVHETYLQGPVWLFPLGLLLVGILGGGLVYSGYWVRQSGFTVDESWRVTIWLFAGLIGALALTFWPIFYQRIVGVRIEDPLFILLVSCGIGANAGVIVGVSQIRTERQLQHVRQVRDSLQFLNRLLRHNILNAISIIRGNAELLVERKSAGSVADRARTIREQSDQIDRLVQNTRVFIQQTEGEVNIEPVNLSAAVRDQVETLQQTYDTVEVDCDLVSDVTVRANPLVSMVVQNLLSNAVVHNDRDKPHLDVSLTTTESCAVLKIADDGPGLPTEDIEQLIDPGHHGDHGLGLYLVDTLVSQYEGRLHFEENEPRGTVVTVELPRSTTASDASAL